VSTATAPEPILLTSMEATKVLNVSESYLMRLVRGEIKTMPRLFALNIASGKRPCYRYRRADLHDWIKRVAEGSRKDGKAGS